MTTAKPVLEQHLEQAILNQDEQPRAFEQDKDQDAFRCLLAKRAKFLATRRQKHIEHKHRIPILVFELNNERYGIKLTELSEIIPAQHCTPVPTSEPHVIGIINLNGTVSSVIDLSQILSHKQITTESNGYILFLRTHKYPIGFRVDVLHQVEHTTKNELDASDHKPLYSHGVTMNGVCLLNMHFLIREKLAINY